jgi:hypothetical protein
MATVPTSDPSVGPGAMGDRLGAIEASLAGLTNAEKLELIARIARSIRSGPQSQPGTAGPIERAERQYGNRMRLIAEIAALPETPRDDGLTNRDHDKILYGSSS